MALRTSGRLRRRVTIAMLLLCATLLALALAPGRAEAHALPVRYNPAQNAVLRNPPTQVQIVFNRRLSGECL